MVTVLYVRNLSNVTSEEQLRLLFSMGGILRVERVKKMRDFAFIHYYKRDDAEAALKQFDGVSLDGCTLEVTWAKPPETQKQRVLLDKRDSSNYLFRGLNFDTFDHNIDLNITPNSSPISGFPSFTRTTPRPRLQLHNIPSVRNSFTVSRPLQLLAYLCLDNGWGDPIFQVSRIDSDPCEAFYACWVIIPGLPHQARRFMSDKICRSPEEAKHFAASNVLKKLGFTDFDFPSYSMSTHPLISSNSNLKNYAASNYPMNASSCPANASKSIPNLGVCTPPKTVPVQSFKGQSQVPNHFYERGQGDASNFMPSQLPSDSFNIDENDSCPPLLDPNTPIEPSSILGLIASVAAANNMDLPLFNKPRL